MHSLIVDDVLILRKILVRILSEYGTCDVAEDGDEAIIAFEEALKTKPYDLICLDIMMPHINGLKVIEMVRLLENENKIDRANNVKIIMISALSDTDTVKSSLELGCDEYLVKPLDIDIFRNKLKKIKLINS